MSDFSNRPLIGGTLTGLRSFLVTDDGHLTGVIHANAFKPGENRAVCMLKHDWVLAYLTIQTRSSYGVPTADFTDPEHQVASLNCTCGFYAFFNGDNHYHDKPAYRRETVAAIVEGYGVCTVGEAGFRASKLRLVALVVPERAPRPRRVRFGRWVSKHDKAVGRLSLGVIAAHLGIIIATDSTRLAWAMTGVIAAFAGVRLYGIATDIKEHARALIAQPSESVNFGALLARYPDVPTYPTVEAALAAHPVTPVNASSDIPARERA